MVGLAIGAGFLATPAAVIPAEAGCLYVTASVIRHNEAPTYLHNGCVPYTNTPWGYVTTPTATIAGTLPPGTPNGTPTGVFFDVRVPFP